MQQVFELQALDCHFVVEHEGQLVLPRQGQLGYDLAGGQVQLDLFAGQVLAFAAHDAAVFVGVAQFAFVEDEEVISRFLGGDPVSHDCSWCGFYRQRADGQGADHFTQGRQQVFGTLGAGRVDQDQALFRRDCSEGRRATDKGTRQEGLDDFILDLVALLLIDLAHLLGFDLFDFLFKCITHHATRQDAFFLASGDQQEIAADVNQGSVFTFTKRRDETVSGQLLACTRARQLGGHGRFQRLGINRQILGQAIDKQVLEPHGVSLSSIQRGALFS
ncbi:hypothetical protein PFLmoz3_00962 [Pseudomonas fluorescens]|uniref:Uncharacterized protein n=1 Tax=Pseudomonas fluorescens TaxID=294 RepID=A0A109LL24_PSEFL|nr:hypothetical protein PFLmoz3_00962 [Pseudomonas fluorescens]